jgi:hypothetical protein
MLRFIAGAVVATAVVVASSCGTSTSSKQPSPSAATTTIRSASPPPGGPVPAQLIGDWSLPPSVVEGLGGACPQPLAAATCVSQLKFTATTYFFETNAPGLSNGGGNVVVNNTEIDFFNGSGCGMQLPEGVGRYTWTLTNTGLHFTALSNDPCPRSPFLANQDYHRSS